MNFEAFGPRDEAVWQRSGQDFDRYHAIMRMRRDYARIGHVPRRRFCAAVWTLLGIEHRAREGW